MKCPPIQWYLSLYSHWLPVPCARVSDLRASLPLSQGELWEGPRGLVSSLGNKGIGSGIQTFSRLYKLICQSSHTLTAGLLWCGRATTPFGPFPQFITMDSSKKTPCRSWTVSCLDVPARPLGMGTNLTRLHLGRARTPRLHCPVLHCCSRTTPGSPQCPLGNQNSWMMLNSTGGYTEEPTSSQELDIRIKCALGA
jgi:hypothetical protein